MLDAKGFDLWAGDYDRSVNLSDASHDYPFDGYQRVLAKIYRQIAPFPHARVLDLGFGTGTLTRQLYALGCRIYGQDFSEEMVAVARSAMPDAHLYRGDFTRGLAPELTGRCYDFIIATYSLHHLTDDEKIVFLSDLLPMVKNGGRILIGDIAFETESQQQACRIRAGSEWDEDEYYWVHERLGCRLPCRYTFETCSSCAGLIKLTPSPTEQFDIVNDTGDPTGEIISRTEAHRLGIQHRTAHVWIVRRVDGHLQILLQKRAAGKDSFPCCYDISSAGHIPAGTDYITSALRELEEELGIIARPEDLRYCGTRRFTFHRTFHGLPFNDRQVTRVYLLWLDQPESAFQVQEEEIDHVKWFDWNECQQGVLHNTFPHCIYPEELEMLEVHLK